MEAAMVLTKDKRQYASPGMDVNRILNISPFLSVGCIKRKYISLTYSSIPNLKSLQTHKPLDRKHLKITLWKMLLSDGRPTPPLFQRESGAKVCFIFFQSTLSAPYAIKSYTLGV